ncbi:MAG: HD-GYP domain-containing protein, partial [Anaerolineales bacterium]|nr:HD-GYP domain-containing protein [Anaerolineales bacterium]
SFFETLAGQAAIAIDNATLFENLQRSNDELRLAYDTTLEGWAHALELHDMETEDHSRRVTNMTTQLAAFMGMDDETIVHVRRGALLHDIGKMGIPDRVLNKDEPLTDEEWDLIKMHPTYAKAMLADIPFLKPALDIPYCHHEKWDGSGYPLGLRGEAIPLAARIFTVIDVYDALTSNRSYRQAWSKKKTIAYIQEHSGTHFDPEVVRKFIELFGEEEDFL